MVVPLPLLFEPPEIAIDRVPAHPEQLRTQGHAVAQLKGPGVGQQSDEAAAVVRRRPVQGSTELGLDDARRTEAQSRPPVGHALDITELVKL